MPSTVCVATYNVYLGADLTKILGGTTRQQMAQLAAEVLDDVASTDFRERAHGIVAALAPGGASESGGTWPDLLGCQEVCRWSTGSLGPSGAGPPQIWCDFTAELLAAFAAAGQRYDVVAQTSTFGGRMPISASTYADLRGHDVVLARRSEVRVESVAAAPYTAGIELPAEVPGLTFEVSRCWTIVRAVVRGERWAFANTHLEAFDQPTRAAQLAQLVGVLEDHREVPAVLLGDLNAAPGELALPGDWTDAWVTVHGAEGGGTWGQNGRLRNEQSRIERRIDYIYSRGAPARGCQVVGDRPEARTPSGLWPSDHAGVVATLGVELR
ncbi:MAG: endonuclease/exonuclease/phosphatase family protein [Actinomycetota bacterium]|nr:endonuclease/exonuclease/phosphatase family protein [Actinomycetota bacterium]